MDSTPAPVPAQVTPGAGVPLHRQLFLVLRDEIARGAIPAGDPLPTEPVLCEQFGVSRITVRRALAPFSALSECRGLIFAADFGASLLW